MIKKNLLSFLLLCFTTLLHAQSWVRVNSVGYLPHDSKVAVFISTDSFTDNSFKVYDASTDLPLFEGAGSFADAGRWGMKTALRLNFSKLDKEGGYYIVCNGTKSPDFRISASAYDGLADLLLAYMRQQRCGYNPYIEVSRFEDKSIYYFVVVRYGIRGYSVLFTTRDLHEAFAFYDEILKENGDKA